MPSLRELQLRFAHSVTAPRAPADPRISIYRNNIDSNVRAALAATYRVTRRHAGAGLFDAAARGYAAVSPPVCGDLNVYGDGFPDFIAGCEAGVRLPVLADLARLEWALDEAQRAAHAPIEPSAVLDRLAAISTTARMPVLRLHPSCRLLDLRHPAMRTWQAYQRDDLPPVDVAATTRERLLVRREGARNSVERMRRGEFEWLHACSAGATLEEAATAASREDRGFDLVAALRKRIGDGTIVDCDERPRAA